MIIAFSNHKGGVGKTTSVVNIGAAMAKRYKVLLVDLDPQANLTQSLGILEPRATIYEAMKGGKLQALPILAGLDLIASTLDLSGAEVELSAQPGREFILRELLEPMRKQYDYILIDSPPSLGILTVNAFTAADQVYIPLQAHYLAMQGLTKLLEVIEMVKSRLNKNLTVGGVFMTQYDKRRVLNRNVEEVIQKHFKALLLKTEIRENIALAEAPAQGLDIFRYEPKSHGAGDYKALTNEIIKRTKL